MSIGGTAALGAVAGFTILLGLPVARLSGSSTRRVAVLTAASVGVLLFLLYDILKNASATIEGALDTDRGTGIAYGVLLAVGLAVGLLGLAIYERRVRGRRIGGPGALAAQRAPASASTALDWPAQRALTIALGIGLHNFAEGLAIGQSAASGAARLFAILVIGFGLHNATEGFGISAPLIGTRPSWRFLLLLGMIGGGPTFLGTLVGYEVVSAPASVLFLALAAGSILYVIGELQHAGRRLGSHDVAMAGLVAGFLAAFGTDLLLAVSGG